MPALPLGFERELTAYDKALRVRWGTNSELWIIERLLKPQQPSWLAEKPSPWKNKKGLDLWEGWKDGYVCVLMVHPTCLHWNLVIQALRDADLQVQEGAKGLIRKLDAAEEQWERDTDKVIDTWSGDAANEAYHRLKWLQGERMVLDAEEREPVTRDLVTQRDGYTVVERRRVSVG